MSDTSQESAPSTFADDLAERSRDIWLAGLGALATVEEEGSKLFTRLVEQGKEFQESRQKQLEEMAETAEEQSEGALHRLEEASEETRTFLVNSMQRALGRLEVPTRTEVDELTERVEDLTEKVDALSKTLADDDPASA